ncbi:unnamed protein product [Blepharisma stoltei]|uniref:Casein kinase I n=1 Tax=Blepharisma stoltei TaxID=1481888 RepID=A0AAU9JEL7_9CILI|nr:unnamed protein product [Blepharisma stoltei]
MTSDLIGNRFQVISKAGEGQFGRVFLCTDLKTQNKCAVKIPSVSNKNSFPQLLNEGKILKAIQGGIGIPKFIKFSNNEDELFLAMQHLGSNLEEKFIKCNRKFSLATVLTIGEQLLDRLEYIHRKGYIHRDLKPRQLLLGNGSDSSTLYVIDYGLSKQYIQKSMNLHIPYTEGRPFEGTAYFASLNTHMGIQQSRRDDLEAYIYMLAYFLNGTLPWIAAEKTSKITERQIKLMKSRLSSTGLFLDKPEEFNNIFKYVRNLEFDAEPDYDYIRTLLNSIRIKNNLAGMGFDFKPPRKKRVLKTSSVKLPKSHKVLAEVSKSFIVVEEDKESSKSNGKGNSSYETYPLTPRKNFEGKCIWIDDDSTLCLLSHPEIKDRSILVSNKEKSPEINKENLVEAETVPVYKEEIMIDSERDKASCRVF